MQTLAAIKARCSVRAYLDTQVPEEVLSVILGAGMAAPVGLAKYDELLITVIQSKEFLGKLNDIAAKLPPVEGRIHGSFHYYAPTVILISASESPYSMELIDAGLIAQNICLAATDLGLSTVVLKSIPNRLLENDDLLSDLNLPTGYKPIIACALGYAKEGAISPKEHTLKVSRL